MGLINYDFKEDFEEISSYNFTGNKCIMALYDGFNSTTETKHFKIYSEIRKDRPFGMMDVDKIKEFSFLLIEYGNLEYCRKLAKIGRGKAIKIIHILNEEALKRNLPLVYKFKNPFLFRLSKLSENQISIIKYLYHKGYSGDKLANIYKVSQSTINAIIKGLIYKNIMPIIELKGERIKPKFANNGNRYTYHINPSSLSWLTNKEQSNKLFKYVLWGETPKCPFCGCTKHYKLDSDLLKCSNNKCYKKFTPIVGTPFENTKVTPAQWLTAMSLYEDDKKISSHQIGKLLDVTQTTGWAVKKRLEKAYMLPLWARFYQIKTAIIN